MQGSASNPGSEATAAGLGGQEAVPSVLGKLKERQTSPILTGAPCASPSPPGADMGPRVSTGFLSPH